MSEPDANVRSSRTASPPEVPDFDLIRPIGSGGFGEVWLGTNRTTGRLRAIKLIPLHEGGKGDRSNLCEAPRRAVPANWTCPLFRARGKSVH